MHFCLPLKAIPLISPPNIPCCLMKKKITIVVKVWFTKHTPEIILLRKPYAYK